MRDRKIASFPDQAKPPSVAGSLLKSHIRGAKDNKQPFDGGAHGFTGGLGEAAAKLNSLEFVLYYDRSRESQKILPDELRLKFQTRACLEHLFAGHPESQVDCPR